MHAGMMINPKRNSEKQVLLISVDPLLLRRYLDNLAGDGPTVVRCRSAKF
jgi:hypothetical protein